MVVSKRGKALWVKAAAALLSAIGLPSIPTAMACSCGPLGDTGAERAETVRKSDWVHLVFVGRVLEKNSYTINNEDNDWGDYPPEFQDVTFSLDETLFNGAEDGSLPQNVVVGGDGSMKVRTSTETTCCICGMVVDGEVGTEYLISLSKYEPESLSSCDINCLTDEPICADTVTALRSRSGGVSNDDHPLVRVRATESQI